MSKAHSVIVFLEAKPEAKEAVKAAIADIAELSRAEPTCIDYRVHEDLNNTNQFIFYENWESKEAHQQQFEKPYIIAFGEKMAGLLAKPYSVFFGAALN